MKRLILSFLTALALAAGALDAQQAAVSTGVPFKLGTFAVTRRIFPGLVLNDSRIVDLVVANAALEAENSSWPKVEIPRTLRQIIASYGTPALKQRLNDIALATSSGPGSKRLFVYDRKAVTVRTPIANMETMLNAAVNYSEHDAEMSRRESGGTPPPAPPPSVSAPGLWERSADDVRWNPYLFIKPRSALTADGQPIRLPPGRDQIDWECEMAVVIGRRASHVPVDRAKDYVFGYTLENDVSDRGGRGDGRMGSDWLIGKGHDTFAPMGPFVVPADFISDPQKLAIKFTLSGTLMQDSTTARMIHTVYELVSYASNILTLQPGDVISTGSPAGVGSARTPPIFLKAGDVAVCTIEGIGTLTNPVVASDAKMTTAGR